MDTYTSVSGAASATFVYDGDGNRVKGTVNGTTTTYLGNYFEWTGSTTTMNKYYYAGATRVAMRHGSSSISWLFSDHLGSMAITATYDGTITGELRYTAWGETRYTYGTTPTTYQYTGQRIEQSLGIYYYGARWYDPLLGRFLQADTIVPGGVQGLDRYAYVFNNPLRYTDPSGHAICDADGYCGILNSSVRTHNRTDDAAIRDDYGYSLSQGQDFVYWLQQNTGWWSEYMTGEEDMWKFLIALMYAYEMGSAWNNLTMQGLMPQAFANKLGYLVDKYGSAGYYIFLGSMETIRIRIDDAQNGTLTAPGHLEDAFTKTAGVWDGSLRSSDPNAPFDFANPMPGKHPAELLKGLYAFANACHDKIFGCDTSSLAGTLYVLASWNEINQAWYIAFIVSYTQIMSW